MAAVAAADDLAGRRRLLLDTYSPATLAVQEERVEAMVRNVVRANSAAGLRAIVERTHTEDPDEPTHPLAMAAAIAGGGGRAAPRALLLNGEEDRLSAPGAGAELAAAAGWRYVGLAGAGHAAPLERPVEWRKEVRALDDDDERGERAARERRGEGWWGPCSPPLGAGCFARATFCAGSPPGEKVPAWLFRLSG